MKNTLKHIAAASLAVLAFASCEEMQDYQKTIDAAPGLAYVNPKAGNTFSTLIVHRPVGSTGSFHTEFQPSSNTSNHGDVPVTIVLDESLVASYNREHGTNYAALPEEYIKLTNPTVVIPADTTASRDTVMIDLDAEKDLSKLTERTYLAPFKLVADGLGASEQMGNLWFIVNTETNIIRPITSADDLLGFPAGGTGDWTADCGNYANLFDGNNSTSVTFGTENVVTIDMKKEIMVTGLKLNTYEIGSMSIEYSVDGKEWFQAGTPADGEYVFGASWGAGDWCAAVYDYFTARYLRLTFTMSGYNNRVNELQVYMIESTEPTLYTQTGADNVVSGKIVHVKGVGSTSDFSTSFKVYTTISSDNGYNVNVAVDNSLIAAYNEKHKTSYAQMPSANINLQNASVAIAAGDNATAENVTLSLTGDLSSLTNENGYLIPLRMAASGAVTSESRGVVYAVINSETKLIKAISFADEITGFPAGGRSTWSADCDDASNLFDGDNSTRVYFENSDNVLTVNLGGKHLVTGVVMNTYSLADVSVQYSTDGTSWKSAGTADDSDVVYTGSSWNQGDYYIAFGEYLEAAYLRLTFGFSGYYTQMGEFGIYEIESTDPTVYTVCGTDNVFTGKIVHHAIAGSKGSVNASFNVMSTVSSTSGWTVSVEPDASLVNAFNTKNRTSYAALDASYVEITGSPCEIAAGSTRSAGQISVALKGDISKLTNKNGYLLPLKLSAPGAVSSASRGVVYVAITVETSTALLQDNFSIDSIEGTQVADRSGWKILECDEGGVHSGSYAELFDGNTTTYVRTWGGPVSFTVDMGQEYDMTGLVITARTDNSGYSRYQPNAVQIMASLDGTTYENLGTAATAEATLVASNPSSYVSLYGSKKVRYLKIEASYGSNMGTAEFNIYAK